MEHGQRDAESIGAILSGIAQTLREVSDKLEAVAARVDSEGTDDSSLAVRLAKMEAWAFRAEQDVAKLGVRLDAVEAGRPRPVDPPSPRPAEPVAVHAGENGARADVGTRPQPPTRAERRELAARAEQDLPTRTDNPLPTRDKAAAPARERLLPRAAANRGERPEMPAAPLPEHVEQPPVTAHAPESGTERRMPAVPAALHDWVEPLPVADPAPRVEPPAVVAERVDTFTPRYEPVPVADSAGMHPHVDYGQRAERLDNPTSPNGRVEIPAPHLNGRESGLTAPRPEPELNGSHRPTIEDNAHVDKLQAMLDELKRNPNGPFGRPLSAGEMPA